VLTYFALVFIISWGGDLIVVGPGGIPGKKLAHRDAVLPRAHSLPRYGVSTVSF